MRSWISRSVNVIVALVGLATTCNAHSSIVFEDPAAKGSLMAFDTVAIPLAFHGTWADKIENCYAVSDRGRQVSIAPIAIGFAPVLKVEGYSDHPAIVVTLQSGEGGSQRVTLDIALDGKHISLMAAGRDAADILVRCPAPWAHTPATNIVDAGWLEQADGACRSRYFELFLEAFLASPAVRSRHLAPRILVSTPGRKRSVPNHQYLRIPIRMLDYVYVINDGSPRPETLKVDVLLRPHGEYRVAWVRATYDGRGEGEIVETYGLPGQLTFAPHAGCWRLTEDNIGPDE